MNIFTKFIETTTDNNFLGNFFSSMSEVFTWLFTSVTIGNAEISVFSILLGAGILLYLGFAVAKFLLP